MILTRNSAKLKEIDAKSTRLLTSIYGDGRIASQFSKILTEVACVRFQSGYFNHNVPRSLRRYTRVKYPSQDVIVAGIFDDIFFNLGILKSTGGQYATAPIINALLRLTLLPSVVLLYNKSQNKGLNLTQFTDPPILEYLHANNIEPLEIASKSVSDGKNEGNLSYSSAVLCDLSEILQILFPLEAPYVGYTSTDAYLNFAAFHLINRDVMITSTTPGAVLVTEYNPLECPDKKKPDANIMRLLYFAILKKAVEITGGKRNYFADETNTRAKLSEYSSEYKAMTSKLIRMFQECGLNIRVGDIIEDMKHATLVGENGVVFSIRDKDEKLFINNFTISRKNPVFLKTFGLQWAGGTDLTPDFFST